MKGFRVLAVMALLTGPAYAQKPVMIHDFNEKTPQEKADDELREKFSKESKKTPESSAKAPSVDPWGNVRSGDAAKTGTSKTPASKTSNAKTATSAKPRARAGTGE
jgi:hypothetical protein